MVKREAEELSIPWDALRNILEFLPPTSNLEHAYVLDRQVLFTLFRLTCREKVDPMRFEAIWQEACVLELENLLVEIVLRADLELTDKAVAYIRIGDFGLRRLLYYTKLEIELEQRREAATRSFKGITPHLIGSEFTWEVGSAIWSWTPKGAFRAWKTGLEQFHSAITDRWWL